MAATTAPVGRDFAVTRGDSWTTKLAFADSAGEPLDLTGWVFTGQLRLDSADRAPGDPAAAMVVTMVAEEGTVALALPASVTAELAASLYRFDVRSSDASRTITWLTGRFAIKPCVTLVAVA